MSVDFPKLMDAVGEATRDHGMDFRGKKYSPVALRVETFRRAYGTSAAIVTEIVHLGTVKGEPVVIRAAISVDGQVVATGTAWEVIGVGNVNQSSALENCETSAVGRALAVLGLHGGEMASANEMAAIETKPANPTREALVQSWEDGVLDSLDNPNPSPREKAEAFCDAICRDFSAKRGIKALDNDWDRRKKIIERFRDVYPDLHERVVDAFEMKRNDLSDKEAA